MGPIVFGRLAARAAMATEPATGYTLKTPVAVITEDMFAKDADSAESLFDMSQTLADGEYEATVDGRKANDGQSHRGGGQDCRRRRR